MHAQTRAGASHLHMADLLDRLPVAVYMCEAPGGVIQWFNRRAVELWGRAPSPGDPDERFCGAFRLYRLDGSPLPHASTLMAEVLRGGPPVNAGQVILERPDGSRLAVTVDIRPVLDGEGRLIGAVNAFRESAAGDPAAAPREETGVPPAHVVDLITRMTAVTLERARVEQERMRLLAAEQTARASAQAAEQRHRDLVDSLDAIVWEANASTFEFSFVSRRAEDILGYPVEQWREEPNFWANHIHPEDRQWAVRFWQTNAREGKDHTFEYRTIARDGREVWLRDVVRVVRDADGRPGTLYGVMVDVTDRKRAEREREELLARAQVARAQAEAASRLKDDFLAVLSHELRTPINAILGWARMLRQGLLPPDGAARALDTIERNARSQAQLIEGLLDLSGIVTGKLRLNVRPVDALRVVEAAADAVRPAAAARGVDIRIVGPPAPVRLHADEERLQQVVWNLLSNGVKFTPAGGRVDAALGARDGSIEIRVTDTGQGISAGFLPHVFDRFRQADSSSERMHGGLGLGLAIVRELVEAHGGSVSAASAGEGLGATFTVVLPTVAHAQQSEEPAEQAAGASAAPGAAKPSLDGLRAVAVDDDPDALELLTVTLERYGASVTPVASVAAALAAIAERGADIVVADIGLPREDGYSLVRKLRGRTGSPRIPAIAVTAYASLSDRQRAVAAGFDRHIAKPFDPEELVWTIATVAGARL